MGKVSQHLILFVAASESHATADHDAWPESIPQLLAS